MNYMPILYVLFFLLTAVPCVSMEKAGTSHQPSKDKVLKMYLDFLDTDNTKLGQYDTTAWGNRYWDAANNQWWYDSGVSVKEDIINQLTLFTFSGFDLLQIPGSWHDARFPETVSVSTSIKEEADVSTAQSSSSSFSAADTSLSSKVTPESERQKLVEAAFWQFYCCLKTRPSSLHVFDTTAWGDRVWDSEWNSWRYDFGITVEAIHDGRGTLVSFPTFNPLELPFAWQDHRFESVAASFSSSSSSLSIQAMTSTSSSSTSTINCKSQLIMSLYNTYKKDQIVDENTWGKTKRYSDDLTAYTYFETGIKVDLRLGVVFFPGYSDALPLPRYMMIPSISTTTVSEPPDWLGRTQETILYMATALILMCIEHTS